jgi:hypothetical protein
MVASPRACRFSYDDVTTREAREQLAAGFAVLRRELSMLLKMLDDRRLEDETLLRSAQIKYDHSVNSYPIAFEGEPQMGHDGRRSHDFSSRQPPSLRRTESSTQTGFNEPFARSIERRSATHIRCIDDNGVSSKQSIASSLPIASM